MKSRLKVCCETHESLLKELSARLNRVANYEQSRSKPPQQSDSSFLDKGTADVISSVDKILQEAARVIRPKSTVKQPAASKDAKTKSTTASSIRLKNKGKLSKTSRSGKKPSDTQMRKKPGSLSSSSSSSTASSSSFQRSRDQGPTGVYKKAELYRIYRNFDTSFECLDDISKAYQHPLPLHVSEGGGDYEEKCMRAVLDCVGEEDPNAHCRWGSANLNAKHAKDDLLGDFEFLRSCYAENEIKSALNLIIIEKLQAAFLEKKAVGSNVLLLYRLAFSLLSPVKAPVFIPLTKGHPDEYVNHEDDHDLKASAS